MPKLHNCNEKRNLKKSISIVAMSLMVFIILMNSYVFANDNDSITVKLNDKPLTFDVQPIMVEDRTMVPLRAIFEALDANVNWEESTQTVFATKGNTFIILQIGNKTAFVNNESIDLDVPAQLVQDRTLVPLRFISESLGAEVNWDGDTQTVSITN